MAEHPKLKLTSSERRASVALAGLFACRMLGLFLLLPVFAVAARACPAARTRPVSAWPWACTA